MTICIHSAIVRSDRYLVRFTTEVDDHGTFRHYLEDLNAFEGKLEESWPTCMDCYEVIDDAAAQGWLVPDLAVDYQIERTASGRG